LTSGPYNVGGIAFCAKDVRHADRIEIRRIQRAEDLPVPDLCDKPSEVVRDMLEAGYEPARIFGFKCPDSLVVHDGTQLPYLGLIMVRVRADKGACRVHHDRTPYQQGTH